MSAGAAPLDGPSGLGPVDAGAFDASVGARIDGPLGELMLERAGEAAVGQGVQMALDAACRAGRTVATLLERLAPDARVVGVDAAEPLLELARRRSYAALGRRAFFKREPPSQLSFGDGVFDLVVAARALEPQDGPHTTLAELARVAASGSTLVVAERVRGAWALVTDLLCEAADALASPEVARRARAAADRLPRLDDLVSWVEASGFTARDASEHSFELRIPSARELRRDPLLRFEALPEWRSIAGPGPEGDRVLEAVEDALDVYLEGRPPLLDLRVGVVVATRG